MTWSNNDRVADTIVQMMMGSWEALVSYQTPLNIAHQFTADVHYGPGPSEWVQQDDGSPRYYNQADSAGLGYDRSLKRQQLRSGQYFPALARRYGNLETVPENLMMWFHHVPWGHRMHNGRPFWKELVYRYQMGVQYVTWMRETWVFLEPHIDARRFREVKAKLATHEADAADWRDTNVDYWREFSRRGIPTDDAPLSATITVDGKQHAGFDLSRKVVHDPGVLRRFPQDHRGHDCRSAGGRGDRLPGRRRPRTGSRQGHHGKLDRTPREELCVSDGPGHDVGLAHGERSAVALLRSRGRALPRGTAAGHDRSRRGGRRAQLTPTPKSRSTRRTARPRCRG